MEDSITLEELFLLYRASNNEFTKQIKASAIAFGGEIDLDDDWYEPEKLPPPEVIDGSNIGFLPIGLGYQAE